jgi:putative inorganic carbon (hco3(-)) transporter
VKQAASVARRSRGPGGAATGHVATDGSETPFVLYCIFVVSYLLHFGKRLPFLGAIHFDVIAGGLSLLLMVASRSRNESPSNGLSAWSPASRWLMYLVAFILLTLPFVEWPGSVLRRGLEPFAKAAVFFVLTVGTVTTSRRFLLFVCVIVACQTWRVLEPLYLHVAHGYWGSMAMAENWQVMDRLAGAPSDTVNPNGLAFIVVTTIPLLHFVIARHFAVGLYAYLALVPLLVWTLLLTGSRSGLVVLFVTAAVIVARSKSKLVLGAAIVVGGVIALGHMSGQQQQRYESIVSKDAPGAGTVDGRINGVVADFYAALERPLFGHGLGTSVEVNAHFRGIAQLSHNLITESAQEIGFIGLLLFLRFCYSAFQECRKALATLAKNQNKGLLPDSNEAMMVLLAVGAVFALASYGLSELYWYLWAGMCVSIGRISMREVRDVSAASASDLVSRRVGRPSVVRRDRGPIFRGTKRP